MISSIVMVIYLRMLELPQLQISAGSALRQKAVFKQTPLAVGPKQCRL